MFEKLEKYRSVAWDFDGVLHDDPRSNDFHEFIAANPYQQVHSIVTFRSHGMQYDIEHILSRYKNRLPLSAFNELVNIPNRMYELARPYLIQDEIDDPDLLPYLEWKGQQCARIGAQVLIDDMKDYVISGCLKYNIDYLHPRDL